ncbi:MAG: radical SAM protein [Methanosarcinaceae archaeon]|nr:radical SAM protein [Methanosarcinaceae archaeon]
MSKFKPLFLAHSLYQMLVRKRPIAISHSVNSNCNLRCSFCNQWQNPEKDISFEEVCNIIDMAYDFGIRVYNAWSAEPLLRKDLPDIMKYAKSRGMTTMMITNGKLLKKRAFELVDIDYVSVSIDGPSATEKIRGLNYDELVSNIKYVIESGVLNNPILMNVVVSSQNVYDIEDLVLFAKDTGSRISVEPVHMLQGADTSVIKSLSLSDSERRYVFSKLLEMKKQGYPIIHSKTYLKRAIENKRKINCCINQSILGIDHKGNLYNCRVHEKPLGNILEKGLKTVWDESSAQRKNICNKCPGCLFFGYAENNLLLNYNIESLFGYEWM